MKKKANSIEIYWNSTGNDMSVSKWFLGELSLYININRYVMIV